LIAATKVLIPTICHGSSRGQPQTQRENP
jgi:hypothetical protein